MYSTHNEGKPVAAKRFIRTLKNKICKCMTSISKNVYIDKLDDILHEYNNTYHRTIKMKPIDIKGNTYTNIGKEVKVGLSPSKKICVICLLESPLKMMKNAFYFMLSSFRSQDI